MTKLLLVEDSLRGPGILDVEEARNEVERVIVQDGLRGVGTVSSLQPLNEPNRGFAPWKGCRFNRVVSMLDIISS